MTKKSKLYWRGYNCGYQRAKRELKGQKPNLIHRNGVSKSKNYQKGLRRGYKIGLER